MTPGREIHNEWSPVNGGAPYWVNLVLWLLKNGVLFSVLGTVALVAMSLAFMGFIENPQAKKVEGIMKATNAVLKEISDQHNVQSRGIKETHVISARVVRRLDVLCANEADKTATIKDDERCEDLIFQD